MKRLCLISLTCLICPASVLAQTAEIQAKVQTVLYIKRLQTPSGGFLVEPPDPKSNRLNIPTLRATSSANRAIKYLGADLPNKDTVVRFVASCFQKESGGFADTPGGKADVFTTAVGLMAVTELGMPVEPYHAAAVKYLAANVNSFDDIRIAVAGLEAIKRISPKQAEWTAEVLKTKVPANEEAGRARLLATQAVTLLRLGFKNTSQDAAAIVKDLKAGQRGDGGFAKADSTKSDLETTYRVMRAFVMHNAEPANVAGLRDFIEKCRGADGGYAVAPGQPTNINATYYAAIITHWLEKS
jgi:prenyltransferase beta subunit